MTSKALPQSTIPCATKGGILRSLVSTDSNYKELSITQYLYDEVDNLTELTTVVRPQGNATGYTQRHKYSYALWDSYQQVLDTATLEINGQGSTTGSSTRVYDVNGQLQEAIDSQVDNKGQNNTTRYRSSSLEGIRARMDKEGQTSYLTVAGKTIGDLRLDNTGATHLEIYGGFTPTGTPTETQAMMPSFWKKDPRVDQALKAFTPQPVNEGTPPEAPQDSVGSYTLHSGDTLESIALQVYGDASLWYLIADANGITQREDRAGERGSQLHAGQSLTIPPAASSQHHTNATHKVLSSADWLGNTSATTPLPPAPPPQPLKKRNSPWRILSLVAVAVVATVATVLTAGALGAALGATVTGTGLGGLLDLGTAVLAGSTGAAIGGSALLGSLSVGFAAGFIGSLAGQGAANILGLQQGIDVKGALITGLATAATAGVGRLLSENSAYQSALGSMDKHKEYFSIKSASEMMERDVLSQSINLGARKHQHLDWLELGISAATAGFIGSNQGNRLNEGLDHTFKKAAPTVSSELHSLTKGALTSAATGARFDAAQILTDNLGQAVADNLVQLGSIGANEAKEGAVDAAKKALKEAENNKAVEKMLKDKANLRAEQEQGAWKTDNYGELYGSNLIGMIANEPKVVGQGALAVKNAETATINSTVNNCNHSPQ